MSSCEDNHSDLTHEEELHNESSCSLPFPTPHQPSEDKEEEDKPECKSCRKYQKRIKELEKKIAGLEKKMMDPDLPVLDLSEDRVQDLIDEKYNEELFRMGQKGIALFVYSYLIRDLNGRIAYIMTDRDKKDFKYRGGDGIVYKDHACNKLFDSFYNLLRKRANKLYLDCINDTVVSSDGDDDEDELDSDTEEVITQSIIGKEDGKDMDDDTLKSKPNGSSVPTTTEEDDSDMDRLIEVLKDIKKAGRNKRIFMNELIYYIESKKEPRV